MSFLSELFEIPRGLIYGPRFDIYTDGGFKKGLGSWAFVVTRRGVVLHESSGHALRTDSLAMELRAIIEAFGYLRKPSVITIFCDARAVLDSIALKENVDPHRPHAGLYRQIEELSQSHKVTWTWVKAHSGNVFNERCDALCRQARECRV